MATAPTLEAARQVHSVLEDAGIRALVIGAVALAAHGYVRGTEDFDFAISVPPQRLPELSERFRRLFPSWDVQCNESDANDPSGGVIHIECPGDDLCVVEVVNFDNSPAGGFPALVENAETLPFIFPNGPQGRLVSLEDLILFKLYAGGTKSRADVDELLARRKVDLTRLTTLATKYGMLGELRLVIPEAAT